MVAASTLESARLLLLSKSTAHPNGIGNSSGHVGHNFCEHVMGPGVTGLVKDRIGKPRTLDDGRPGGFYVPRFRNLSERHPNFIRGYGFEGGSGTHDVSRQRARARRGSAPPTRSRCATTPARSSAWAASARCCARYENQVELDPVREGQVGHSGAAVQLQVRRQREEDVRGHGRDRAGDVRARRASRSSTSTATC